MLNKKYFPILIFLVNIVIIFGYAFVQNLLSKEYEVNALAEFREYSVDINYDELYIQTNTDLSDDYIPSYIYRDEDSVDKLPENIENDTAANVVVYLKKYDGDVSISKLQINGPVSKIESENYDDYEDYDNVGDSEYDDVYDDKDYEN